MVSASLTILDSELLDKLPGKILASTGMDALTHAIEAYVCKAANPITDGLALLAIQMIQENILKAVKEHTPEALDAMLAASTMAGMALVIRMSQVYILFRKH